MTDIICIGGRSFLLVEMDQILATLIVLQHNLRLGHWEIVGPNFIGLHTLLGTQYQELGTFIDRVAEFMRMNGKHTITLNTALDKSKIKELTPGTPRSWETLVAILANNISTASTLDQDVYDRTWNKIADDLHEWLTKQAWLLRSHLLQQ